MKENCIIYCRKSTDRDELQQNSLDHQLNNCHSVVKFKKLEIVDEIVESKSAKEEFKRDGFNKMIDICKEGKIDYIVIDEPKRLSRNNIDTSRVIDLLDKKQIKGIFCTSREYISSNNRDKFLLQLDLSLSKMDNEDRGKDVRDKMITAVKKGQYMGKAILGYRNIGNEGNKDVKVIEEEAEIVRDCFLMRKKGLSLGKIAKYVNDELGKKRNSESVRRMLTNTKYYGIQEFAGIREYITTESYEPIISEELFNEVNGIKSGRTIVPAEFPKYFYNILKDTEGNILYGYEKIKKSGKKYIYYHNNSEKAKDYINISQLYLFDEIGKHIKQYDFPLEFVLLVKEYLKSYYKTKNEDIEKSKIKTEKEIEKMETRKKNLFNMYLDGEITKDEYDEKRKEIESDINNNKEKIKGLNQGDENVEKSISEYCELIENLSGTYINGNNDVKGRIIRAMNCELIINNKKELVIKENKLFNLIKNVNHLIWYS